MNFPSSSNCFYIKIAFTNSFTYFKYTLDWASISGKLRGLWRECAIEGERARQSQGKLYPRAPPLQPKARDSHARSAHVVGEEPGGRGQQALPGGVEYVLTCFWSHDPAISLAPVITGPVAATEDAARESVQDAVELVAECVQRDPADDE
jgi:hypothetical protein